MGWSIAEGFCSQLIYGYYCEDYDPCMSDVYRKVVNGIPISVYARSMYEEYEALTIHEIINSDALIYIVGLREGDLPNIDPLLESLTSLAKLALKHEIPLKYVIGIFWKGISVDDNTKKNTMEAIQKNLKECDMQAEIMECSIHSRTEVEQLMNVALKYVEPLDWKKFLAGLPSFKHLKKKHCLCM